MKDKGRNRYNTLKKKKKEKKKKRCDNKSDAMDETQ